MHSLDELMDTAELLAAERRPHNSAIALGCDSGGERQLIVDLAEKTQIQFAQLGATTLQNLEALLSPGVEAINPLDYWGDGQDVMADTLITMAQDPMVGTVVMATNMAEGQDFMYDCCRALEKTWQSTNKPVVLMGNVSATMSPIECNRFRDMGLPVLMGTPNALLALSHYGQFIEQQNRLHQNPNKAIENCSATALPNKASIQYWQDVLHDTAQAKQTLQSFELLKEFSIPIASSLSTSDWSQALTFASQVGYPLVAKIDAADVAHKSDMGGVILNIANDEQLAAAWQELQKKLPGNILIQSQLQGTEIILGMKKDFIFGPIFTIGLGGIFVEIMKDLALLLPTDDSAMIQQALLSLKGAALLQGARGKAPADLAQLVSIIKSFMTMCMSLQHHIQEVEINPLLVSGQKMAAVDFLMIPA